MPVSESASRSHPSSPMMALRSRDKKPNNDIKEKRRLDIPGFPSPRPQLPVSKTVKRHEHDSEEEEEDVDVERIDGHQNPANPSIYPNLQEMKREARITSDNAPRSRLDSSCARQEECRNGKSTDSSFGSQVIVVVSVVILVVLALTCSYYLSRGSRNAYSLDLSLVFGEFQAKWILEDFNRKFPNQGDRSWRMVRTVVRVTTALSQPKYPGVLTLVSSDSAESTSSCLARKLAVLISRSYNDSNFVDIDLKKIALQSHSADTIKEEIDGEIRRALSRNSTHVVLLEALHVLPPEAGVLLHGLCDNENAPFKRAIFIITSVVDDNELKLPEADVQVTSFWKGKLDEDKRNSLETRIGNNPILVKPETMDILDRTCTV